MRSHLPSILYTVLVGPAILWQLFHRQDTHSILTGLMLILIPFFVWAACMIGRPALLWGSGPALIGGYVPDPHVNWISIAEIVESMPPEWAAAVREDDPFLFKVLMVPRFIELALKNHIEANADEKFHGILINFADENVLHLTISSDREWTRVLGMPYPLKTAAPEHPGALLLKEKRRTHDPDIYKIRIENWCSRGHIWINGLRIHQVEIGSQSVVRNISISNSWINELVMEPRTVTSGMNVQIGSSRLGHLLLTPHCCENLNLRNVLVRRITCPPPERGNAFEGSMILSGAIEFDSGSASIIPEQLQNYRNLRNCLMARGNMYAAHVVRASELRSERRGWPWLVRVTSWFFDIISDYGTNAHRPVAFMALMVVFNFLLVWINGLAVPNLSCEEVAQTGWLASLCGESVRSKALGAFLLAFQPFIDPLGPLRADKLVLAKSFSLSVWLWLSSLICLGLLAIATVSVRRTMKE